MLRVVLNIARGYIGKLGFWSGNIIVQRVSGRVFMLLRCRLRKRQLHV
eukprot:COSAG06_NODE_51544_length_311_cov_0.971698_1_plen_47_part_10